MKREEITIGRKAAGTVEIENGMNMKKRKWESSGERGTYKRRGSELIGLEEKKD